MTAAASHPDVSRGDDFASADTQQRRHHHPERVAGLRLKRTRLTTRTHTRPMMGETNREAGEDGGDQDPRAMAVVKSHECVGRRADLRLIAVDDVGDDEEDDEVDAAHAPQAFPEGRGGVRAGGRRRDCSGRAHDELLLAAHRVWYGWMM